ncbi:MAG: hypothetical protein RR787_06610 [Hydrogenoanaerobacterium sp.]
MELNRAARRRFSDRKAACGSFSTARVDPIQVAIKKYYATSVLMFSCSIVGQRPTFPMPL